MAKQAKSRKLKVIAICSECGEPVAATKNDNAYRHGFNRHRLKINNTKDGQFSQEDGSPCKGSGQPVLYKRKKRK